MTFIPSVISKVDAHNTTAVPLEAGATFTGSPTSTSGYDTVVVTVEADVASGPGGLEIQFAEDANPASFTTFFSDSVLAGVPFTNTYLVLKQFYRVLYTTASATSSLLITARISPQLDSASLSQANKSIGVFNNAAEQAVDAFGRKRVSTPSTLIDIRFPTGAIPATPGAVLENALLLNQYFTGGGWGIGTSGDGTLLLLATPGSPPGVTLTQSRTFVTYQPGKSFLMMFSGVFSPLNTTYQSAVGLFDTDVTTPLAGYVNNGVYLSFAAGVPAVNVCSTGTATSFPQSAWNVDKMDGTGPSGLTLDFAKAQLFVIDLEWLGVGRIRYGFYAYGQIQYCHQITNINALTGPYTPSMDLPVSYMLWSGAPVGGASITQICSTVVSEGGYNPIGRAFSANTGFNSTTQEIQVGTSERPLLAIRGSVAQGYYHQTILPTNFSVIDTNNNNTLLVRVRYYYAAAAATSIVATTWTPADSTYSLVEYAQGKVANVNNFTTFLPTGSVVITSSYILGKGSNVLASLSTAFTTLLSNLSSDIINSPDVLLITAQRVGTGATTANVWASIDWQEVY
jgi:hypothetical protein